jgi:hypothetical protein
VTFVQVIGKGTHFAMGFLTYLGIFYLIVIVLVSYVLLCGGELVWLKKLVKIAQNGIKKILGERIIKKGEKVVDYCCYKPNPILQVRLLVPLFHIYLLKGFYLLLVLGGYAMFIKDALHHIPGFVVMYYHI